jgi:hypothetical protein
MEQPAERGAFGCKICEVAGSCGQAHNIEAVMFLQRVTKMKQRRKN